MYQYKENPNENTFFKIPKSYVHSKLWRGLPLSTKSIFPVIGSHMNSRGVAYPGQETIAALSGCDLKTVRTGIEGMLNMPNVEIRTKITKQGRRMKKYKFTPPTKKEPAFSFYGSVITFGHWRLLRKQLKANASHAVYVTLLAYAFYDIELDLSLRTKEKRLFPLERLSDFYKTDFPKRKYEFVSAELDITASQSGVSLKTAKKAILALQKVGLLKEIPVEIHQKPYRVYQIFKQPPTMYSRDDMNSTLSPFSPKNKFIDPGKWEP